MNSRKKKIAGIREKKNCRHSNELQAFEKKKNRMNSFSRTFKFEKFERIIIGENSISKNSNELLQRRIREKKIRTNYHWREFDFQKFERILAEAHSTKKNSNEFFFFEN